MTHPPTPSDTPDVDFVSHTVVDEADHTIGTVVDVVYDDRSDSAGSADERPAWLVVAPGRFKAQHWVPVAGSYRSATGNVVVPWDREIVKHAPKASGDHLLTARLRDELRAHYELDTLT